MHPPPSTWGSGSCLCFFPSSWARMSGFRPTAAAAGRGATDSVGQVVQCDIRNLGYWETQWPTEMPTRGQIQPVPLKAVHRPDFSLRGIDGTQTEVYLPEDIGDLWQAFAGLPPDRRRRFLQVGSMWQLALSLGHEYQTTRFAWMVAACEVLKSPDPQFRDHNIYHVVEALLGKPTADLLQEQWFRPQDVRNAHLHRGEFRGSEFVQHAMMSSFQDPTFDQACRVLYQITQAAIIEWLRQRGTLRCCRSSVEGAGVAGSRITLSQSCRFLWVLASPWE